MDSKHVKSSIDWQMIRETLRQLGTMKFNKILVRIL